MSVFNNVLRSHTQAPKSVVGRDKATYPHPAKGPFFCAALVISQAYVGRSVPIKAHFFVLHYHSGIVCFAQRVCTTYYTLLGIDHLVAGLFVNLRWPAIEIASQNSTPAPSRRPFVFSEPKSPFPFVPEAATFRDPYAFQLLPLIKVRKHGGTKPYTWRCLLVRVTLLITTKACRSRPLLPCRKRPVWGQRNKLFIIVPGGVKPVCSRSPLDVHF